jgi:hypothetical protein
VEPKVLREALITVPYGSSPASNAASLLSTLDATTQLRYMPVGVREDFLRAAILAMGRLAIHASSTIVNESMALQQKSAVSALNAMYDVQRPLTSWADEVQAEEEADRLLSQGQEVGGATVPAARDDPAGPSETPADFGQATSATGSVDIVRDVSGVPQISRSGLITFGPPADS